MKNENPRPWRGYDYDQLVYLQAVNMVRRQTVRSRIMGIINVWRHPFAAAADGQISGASIGRAALKAVFSGLDKMDYIIMGVTLYKKIRHLLKRHRSKK